MSSDFSTDERGLELTRAYEILIDLARSAREGNPDEVLEAVADAVRRGSGFREVAINVYVPALDEYRVALVKGSMEAQAALAGTRILADQLKELIGDATDRVPGVFFLAGEDDQRDRREFTFTPEIVPSDLENAWQAVDALLVMLRDSSGMPLGFVSVDAPETGLRPSDDDLRLLRAIAAHAEQALETARRNSERDRTERIGRALVELAMKLPHAATFRDLEAEVGEVLSSQFGFERAAVYSRSGDGQMMLRQTQGWDPESRDAHLPDLIPAATVNLTLTAERLMDGCWLIPAVELFPDDRAAPRSKRNGRGPHGWRDHCLVVPAYTEGNDLRSILVLEDPSTRALPPAASRVAVRLLSELSSSAWTAVTQRERMTHLASHDPLTGLRNRRGLVELISHQRDVAFLVCDIDHFKSINDHYGHDTGDRVLERVGELLLALARESDVAIRLGGEEFGMVLPQTDRSGALAAAERLRALIEERLTDIIPEGVTVSIGVAATSEGLLDAEQLMSAADRGMYHAKKSGRNRVGA